MKKITKVKSILSLILTICFVRAEANQGNFSVESLSQIGNNTEYNRLITDVLNNNKGVHSPFLLNYVNELKADKNNFLESNEGRGGGDRFALDVLRTAKLEVLPVIYHHPDRFKASYSDMRNMIYNTNFVSYERVYESCNQSGKGREAEMCFNPKTGNIHISRSLYPIDIENSPSKQRLILHELNRKLGVEGDYYEESSIVDLNSSTIDQPSLNMKAQVLFKDKSLIPTIEMISSQWIKAKENKTVFIEFKSQKSYIAEASFILYKRNQLGDVIETKPFNLQFSNKAISEPIYIEDGYTYSISFLGQIHSFEHALSGIVKNPPILSLKVIGVKGDILADFGEVKLQIEENKLTDAQKKSIHRSNFENGLVRPASAEIFGILNIK